MTTANAFQQQPAGPGPALAGQPAVQAAPTATSAAPGTVAPGGAPAGPADGGFFWVIIAGLVLMMLFTTLTTRKQKRQRAKMLSELRKHDRVVTAGGIIGSVVEVKPDVVVLRVDENRETKLTFTRDAITNVLQRDASESADAASAKTND